MELQQQNLDNSFFSIGKDIVRQTVSASSIKLTINNLYTFKKGFLLVKARMLGAVLQKANHALVQQKNSFHLTYYLISQVLVGSALLSLGTA